MKQKSTTIFQATRINTHNAQQHQALLQSMYALRNEVFNARLKWNPVNEHNMEQDQYDNANATYIVIHDEHQHVAACSRLIPTTEPYMLADVFPEWIDNALPRSPNIFELTRLAKSKKAPGDVTRLLLIELLTFGLKNNIHGYVALSELKVEKILTKIGWKPTRLGEPKHTGSDISVAVNYPINQQILNALTQ